jgi:acyl-CoA dehydrogenase
MTAHRFDAVRTSPFYRSEHEAFRQSLRKFVAREIEPFANDWDEAGEFPRELYKKAAAVGYMGLGFPERYGGTEGDRFMRIIAMQEIGRAGCGGVAAGLFSHTIGAPPILHHGSEAMKARVLPQVLSGEKISALAITEPSGGSDVANLRTTARRDADHYVLNGSKTFITSGMRADFITLAARTGGPGASGVSLILVEGQPEGLQRTSLKKMGWWCSDTATLYFDNCRAGREPDRRGGGGLPRHHAQLQRRTPARRGRRDLRRARLPGGGDRIRKRPRDLRQADRPASGDTA